MKYRINKQKCLGINRCGICLRNCTGATREGSDGKSEIIDQEKLSLCGGVNVCPKGAIEEIDEEGKPQFIPSQGRGVGLGRGRGMGAGRGRGLGLGPRDGRGGGRVGGGRRG
jgi:NAD-dependent dihydropyrimidine dehydrogenase PreA subunit